MKPPVGTRAGLALLVLFTMALSAWLTQAAGLGLHFDEAQYWEWSQRLDWSYYSKGPLVAWLIALSERVFGHGEWQTRLPAWGLHGVWLLLLYGFTLDAWGSRKAAWWAVLIGLTTPIYFALGLVMTTDILLFTTWTWALWSLYRALFLHRPMAWYMAGAAIGLGALGKLSIALLPLSALPLILISHRHVLRSPQLWGGIALMLLIMSPLLYWNMNHDWLMFRHELHHVEGSGRASPIGFFLGQWLVLSPIIVLVAAWKLWRYPPTAGQQFLWWTTLLVLAFFAFKSISAKVQLNWPAPAYIGLIILFSGHIPGMYRAWKRTIYLGMATSILMIAVIFFPSSLDLALGLTLKKEPLHDLKYWRQTIEQIQAIAPKTDFIFTHNYQIAAELAYYWQGPRLPVHIPSFGQRRYNQHDLWPGIESEQGHDGLYVSSSTILPEAFQAAFSNCHPAAPVRVTDPQGKLIRTLFIRVCQDYRKNNAWIAPVAY